MAYDVYWSDRIAGEFWKKHTEACELVLKMYHVTSACAARWLSCDQDKWNNWKYLVKYVEKSSELTEKLYNKSEKVQRNYCTFVKYYKQHCKRISYPRPTKQLDLFPGE